MFQQHKFDKWWSWKRIVSQQRKRGNLLPHRVLLLLLLYQLDIFHRNNLDKQHRQYSLVVEMFQQHKFDKRWSWKRIVSQQRKRGNLLPHRVLLLLLLYQLDIFHLYILYISPIRRYSTLDTYLVNKLYILL